MNVTLSVGDCLKLLKVVPSESIELIVTSPPYNIGKPYEKPLELVEYYCFQKEVIKECYRVLKPTGSICWQIGSYINNKSLLPLDIFLYPIFKHLNMILKNRIIWHFGHGLHASKKFSGRYETILWFVKNKDYFFNLDPIRVPQKYPNKKHYKGKNKGKLSCNPLGKNPSDVWDIPNVKNNHPEKTLHPCQFPIELVERLILSLTKENDTVLDPFIGVGSTAVACLKNNRKIIGFDIKEEYIEIAKKRILKFR